MATVEFTGLTKSFAGNPIIRGVNIKIEDGEFAVLVGPSGCGKSTLLRMLAGLEEASTGDIAIDGKIVNSVDSKDRDIAMVFQSYALYPHMTVEQNMGFSLLMRKVRPDVIAERVRDASRILALDALLQRYPRELSGGQRQRVAMGRAIVRSPKVFLFDEPLSNLDAKLRVTMRAEIKLLHQRLRTTTVYVTHDQIEAMTLADRIVVMNGGVVEQVGRPLDLYDRPANLFVAQFIGSPAMNLIPARTAEVAGRLHAVSEGGTPWPLPPNAPIAQGREIVYGVRPEHLHIIVQPDSTAAISAQVAVVEPTGASTEVHVKIHDAALTVLAPGRAEARPGQAVRVAPELQHVHIFDASTGKRLDDARD